MRGQPLVLELGSNNPQQHLNTVIYMVGLYFALQGGVEHQHLRRPGFKSQIEIVTDDRGWKGLCTRMTLYRNNLRWDWV